MHNTYGYERVTMPKLVCDGHNDAMLNDGFEVPAKISVPELSFK